MPEMIQDGGLWRYLATNSTAIAPALQVTIFGLGILLVDHLLPAGRKKLWIAPFTLIGLAMACVYLIYFWEAGSRLAFSGMVTLDSFARYFDLLFVIGGFLAVLMSYRYLDVEREQESEYYALILFSISGMMFMAGALDLVTIFVGLELMSISTYILVGFLRRQRRSNEASIKYFLLGAFSTGVILYGMSILYGIAGTTNLAGIGRALGQLQENSLAMLALTMMIAGLCFKIAAAPFHMWVPDAYEGAPTAITAFMSVAVKAAAFSIFFRIVFLAFGDFRQVYLVVLAVIAMVTMTWGNVAAMTQNNVKRLLAYSSISHAGYVLMGLVAGTHFGITASAVYLLAYTFMNLGTWTILILLRRQDIAGEELEDFNGLYFKRPVIAVLMLVFLLSLGGIPPLAGFIAKYFVFAAVIQQALSSTAPHVWVLFLLALVGALNVVVSLYYYLRIVVAMFVKTDYVAARLSFSTGIVLTLLITGLLTVLIGVYPEPFINLARTAGLPLV
ncbi:MAG: NADH-quinone oxidoreductase subunit N [Acidobacteriota bacterium]